MRLKPNGTPLILLLLFPLFIQAQGSLPKTLLWRITPPGGGKPSWLCGTIHVQDRRVFNFPDSLYDALGRADAFAMELDPDTLVQAVFAQLNRPSGRKDGGEKSEAGERSSRSGRKRRAPETKDDDMPTIVDLYLSQIAKDMGKPVTGLEKFADQSSLLDDMEEGEDKKGSGKGNSSFHSSMERMINLYADGDLQGVYEMTRTFDPSEMDKLLVQRNRKMASRMDSLLADRSFFFAVGAAHLPGPDGLIEAMTRRGYIVEPVLSSRRMAPDHYVFRHRTEWKTFSDPYQGWSVDLPGKPFPVSTGKGFDMTGYMDLGDLRMYFLTGVAMGEDDILHMDTTIINRLGKAYENNSAIRIDSFRRVETSDTLHSWDMFGSEGTSNYRVRMRIALTRGRMFLVFLGTKHAQELFDERSEKYLGSFHALPVIKGLRPYADSTMGFTVLMPGMVKKKQSEHDSTVSAWHYTCGTATDGMAANVIVVTTAPNFVITSDSAYFRRSAQNMVDREMTVDRQVDTVVNGQNAMLLVFRTSDGAFLNHMLSVKRGGRIFTLLATEDVKTPAPAVRARYLSSLQLMEPHVAWTDHQIPGTDLLVRSPDVWTLRPPEDEAPHGAVYLSYDSTSSVSYNIYLDTLNRYTWSTDDSLLLDHYIIPYHFKGQEELNRRYFKSVTDARCLAMSTRVEDSRQVKRTQICLQGDRLVTATSYLPGEWEHDEQVDAFFRSAIPPRSADAMVLRQREPDMIFRDLRSNDADLRDTAYEALETFIYPIGMDMQSVLMKEILKGFPQDSANGGRIENKLLRSMANMADSTTLPLIKRNWGSFRKDQEYLRYDLLEIVSGLKTKDAFHAIPVLLKEHLPLEYSAFNMVSDLEDTVELAKGIWKELLPFSGDSLLGPELFRLHRALIDSGLLTMDEFRAAFPNMQGALQSFDRQLASETFTPFSARGKAIFDLLGRMDDEPSRAWLRKYMGSSSSGGRMYAAVQLLKQGQPVDGKVWTAVARDKEARLDLYDELNALDKLKLFPKEFLNRKSFAEGRAWLTSEDDYSPKSIHYLREVTTSYGGEQRTFLLFRIYVEDEEGDYSVLAIVGPYKPGSKDRLPDNEEDISGIYEDEEYAPGLEQRHLEAYLKQFTKSE